MDRFHVAKHALTSTCLLMTSPFLDFISHALWTWTQQPFKVCGEFLPTLSLSSLLIHILYELIQYHQFRDFVHTSRARPLLGVLFILPTILLVNIVTSKILLRYWRCVRCDLRRVNTVVEYCTLGMNRTILLACLPKSNTKFKIRDFLSFLGGANGNMDDMIAVTHDLLTTSWRKASWSNCFPLHIDCSLPWVSV